MGANYLINYTNDYGLSASTIPNKYFTFEIPIVDHCNLKCNNCCHWSPYADKYFMDYNVLEKDLRRISKLSNGYCFEIRLLGGEPLLHPNIVSIIKLVRSSFKDLRYFMIATNGTLLDRMGIDFWEAARDCKVIIKLSIYKPFFGFERKWHFLCRSHNVDVFTCFKGNYFYDLPIIFDRENENVDFTFEHCFHRHHCLTLKNGRFYMCCFLCCIDIYNKHFGYSIFLKNQDTLSIYDINSLKDIKDYRSRPTSLCRYCHTGSLLSSSAIY